MAGATPFLDGLLAAARARRHPAARAEGVHLRRSFGAAVADPQGRRYFDSARGHPGVRLHGGARHHRRFARRSPTHAADTDGRAGHRRRQAGPARRRAVRVGEIRARGPQMLVGYLHPEDERDSFDDEGLFPHRRPRPLGGRRLPRGDRPRQGHHHPQRREHLAQGGRGHPRRPSRTSPRSPSSACPTPAPASGPAPSSSPTRQPGPDVASLRDFLVDHGVAKFKVPEQVVIWDALPKNDAGKVLKHQIRADADEARERR